MNFTLKYTLNNTNKLILTSILIITALCSANTDVKAQAYNTPGGSICLYRSETIVDKNPYSQMIIVQVLSGENFYPVEATSYIKYSIQNSNDDRSYDEVVSTTIQYNISGKPYLGDIRIYAWVGDRSIISNKYQTLSSVLYQYLSTNNPNQRKYYAYVLRKVLDSPENNQCNQ